MTAYNTYQEAKIANPESDIFFMHNGDYRTGTWIDQHHFGRSSFTLCNPADHCIRYGDFLTLGYRFVDGDAFLSSTGEVVIVTNAHANNRIMSGDNKRFVLRAAALENIPTETPEEKEALDGIESAGEVEWKNGDECEIEMQEGVRRYLFGCECPNNQQTCIVFTKDGGGHMVMPFERLKKPETPQQREERERLEAAYDLYCHIAKMSNRSPYSFDQFASDSTTCYRKEYLEIVCKTNYRKEKTHGAN
ncbi:hypothetical protein VPHK165_0089 [Vibrio phage K165]